MSANVSQNKQLIAEYLNTLSGHPKTPELVARFVSDPNLVEHIEQVEAGFPSYELVAEDTIGERDLVAVRGVFRGVHRGSFAGVEPTSRSAEATLMIIYRILDGRISEHWLQFDSASLLQQLQSEAAA
jgi:predicted ester cyclase